MSGAHAVDEPGSDGSAHAALGRAAEVMHEVRERCVWTQEITHEALVPYLIEESHELIDAIESGSRAELREELGDLLWQVLFHAEIASRDPEAPFDIDDVAGEMAEKMVRRHPHVFAGETAATPEEVLVHWNAAKAAEKRERTPAEELMLPGSTWRQLERPLDRADIQRKPSATALPVWADP